MMQPAVISGNEVALAWRLAVVRCMLAVLTVLMAVALPGMASVAPALAQSGRSVVWDDIDVTVELREDGSFHITERDRIDFNGGPFRSGFREIPLARIEGFDNVRVGEIQGDSLQPYEYVPPGAFTNTVPNTYTYRRVGSNLRVDWSFPPTTSRERTFQMEFDAYGALRVYDEGETSFPGPAQQISWIGVDHEITESAPVNSATLRIVLPRPVDPGEVFIQGPGSERPEDHTEDGQTWVWTTDDLGRGDSLEAGLRFERLVEAEAPAWQAASDRREQELAEQEARG
jgi:hypothetical protein